MRRADRLFQMVQMLRTDRSITAKTIAEHLEVSERTIYRDMQDISTSGVPIISEPGKGYKLMPGYRLPPLMFDRDEIAALLLGARMIKAWTDQSLGEAAQRVIDKVQTVLPEHLQKELDQEELLVPDFNLDSAVRLRMNRLRSAIRKKLKVSIEYADVVHKTSLRVIHPLGLFYWGRVWTLVGWCELRDDFRSFRLDRIQEMEVLSDVFSVKPGGSLQDYLELVTCDER